MKGKTVVVPGTTNEQAIHNVDRKSRSPNIVTSPDQEQSYQMLVAQGRCVRDRRHFVVRPDRAAQGARKFKVVGDYLSYDPYGIMFPQGRAASSRGGRSYLPQLGSGGI